MTTTFTSAPGQAASSAETANTQTQTASRKRSRSIVLGGVILVVLMIAAAWLLAGWPGSGGDAGAASRYEVVARSFNVVLREKGELKAVRSTDIKCEVEGRSTIISLIDEGAAVQEGDLLVELASDEIENRIQQDELKESNAITAFESAKAELEIQRDKNASDIRKADLKIELSSLELEKYEKGEWSQKRKDAEIAIEEAQITLERRREDYEAAKELFSRNFITRTEHAEDEFRFQKAQWDLDKAVSAKHVLERYTHVAELRQKQSDVEEARKEALRTGKNAKAEEVKKSRAVEGKGKELQLIQTQLAKLRTLKEKCRITAPSPGFVVYYSGGGRWMSADNEIKEGATVHERQILMQLPDTSEMTVVVRVHEAKTDRLTIGQRAVIEVEGVPDKQFPGTVTKIAVLADTQNRWLNPDLKEYETEITLDPTDVPLKPGATAHVEIMVEAVVNASAVPVQAVFTKAGQRYVFRQTGSTIQPTPIELGAVSDEWAQIISGLSIGDQVLLAFSDEHKRLIPDAKIGAERGGQPGMKNASRGRKGKAKPRRDGKSGPKKRRREAARKAP